MKKIFFIPFILFSIFSHAQDRLKSLDTLIAKNQTTLAGGGGGVTVILVKDGKTIYSRSLGNFSPDKAIPIASASKWYAGVLLMTLVHDKKVSLSDKVSKYIPSFKGGDKKNITVGQCFAMTSGLPGGSEEVDEFMADRSQTMAEMVDKIAKTPLVATPGKQLNYGGLGMQVAGRVCEIVGGKDWNTLFTERVVTPLGLKHTFYAGFYRKLAPRIAGGVVSCASDYLHLLQMLANKGTFNGKVVLSHAEVEYMLSDQTGKATIGYSPFTKYKTKLDIKLDARYGVGNWVISENEIEINTSPGAFGFTPWIDRKRGYYGVIAVRNSFPKVMPIFWQMLKVIDTAVQ